MREPQPVTESRYSSTVTTKKSPILVKTFKAKYSVIIVSYNCRENLSACLASVEKFSPSNTEIIVVDNNSQDNTSELKTRFNEVQWIFNQNNEGYSKGCNIGSKASSGEFLIFLNPDTQVTPNWLENMEAHFSHGGIGAVGPVSNYVAGLQKYESFTQKRIHSTEQILELAKDIRHQNKGKAITTKLLIGFCFMIPKKVFDELGQMDENLFLGNDDLDICWRLQSSGLKLAVAADTYIYHEGQKSFQTESSETVTKLVEKSTNALYEKLVKHYGNEAKVPSPRELWGMDWFNPTNKGRIHLNSIDDFALHTQKTEASWIIYITPADSTQSIKETINSIALEENMDVLLCNHGAKPVDLPHIQGLTQLNLPSQTTGVKGVVSSLMLAKNDLLIFCRPGMVFSSHFHHVINHLEKTPEKLVKIPQKTEMGESEPVFDKLCVMGAKDLFLNVLSDISKDNGALNDVLNMAEKNMKLPSVLWKANQESSNTQTFSNENFGAYPESIRKYLNQYKYSGFSETKLDSFWSAEGNVISPDNLECLIYRHSDEQTDQIQSDLKKIKELCPKLKKFLLLRIFSDSRSLKNTPPTALANSTPIQKAKQSLWECGYYIHSAESFGLKDKEPSNPKAEVGEGIQIDCEPRSEAHHLDKKVSIILIGFNQAKYTKKCIESIVTNTKQNYELILIDNGSEDETAEYFKSIPNAKVILNSENVGVAKGWNQGIKQATGDYLLIFNNDTIVNPNWLENMVRLAECNPKIGIVGPRSNNISGPQLIENCSLNTESDISIFSRRWQNSHELSVLEAERITGFCMLISRQAFKEIGYFDERFGKGNFEDDDYCLRARYRGYQLLIANDSFVFHFGSVSYSHQSVSWQNQMKDNMKKFQEKWSRGVAALADTQVSEMEEASPVENWARQAEEAYKHGDIETAREYYLSLVEKDPNNFVGLGGLGIISFHLENYPDALSFFKKALSLKPRDEDTAQNILDVLNKGCDAQQTEASINALITQFPDNPIFIKAIENNTPKDKDHWQKHIENLIRDKRYEEAIDILENLIKTQQHLAFCYNSLGIIAYQCQDAQMAWNQFEKSLSYNLFDEDTLVNYCDAGITLGKKGEVLATLSKVFSYPGKENGLPEPRQIYHQLKLQADEGSWDPEKIIASREQNIAGENLIREGLLEKAETMFNTVLSKDPQNFRSYNNLGLIFWYRKDVESAWNYFKKALNINPSYVDALVNGFDACLSLRSIEEYRLYLDEALRLEPQCREAGEILHLISQKGEDIYSVGNFEEADSSQQKIAEGDSQLKEGNLDSATLSYLDALDLNPQNYKAINGLGVVAYKRKMNQDAHRLFEAAVLLNPLDEDSLLNLWENSKTMNTQSQVIHHLQNALQMDPSLVDIRSAVDSFKTE